MKNEKENQIFMTKIKNKSKLKKKVGKKEIKFYDILSKLKKNG